MQAFLQAETKASDTVRKVSEHVKDEPEQDSESLYMHERLVAIEHPAYPAPVRVAISGNSGIGKSTLINAILGLPELCPTVSAPLQYSLDFL
jgi:predicted GTPase